MATTSSCVTDPSNHARFWSVLWSDATRRHPAGAELALGIARLMPSGRADALGDLPDRLRALLERARRGVMTTLDAEGGAHSVPVVFVVIGEEIVSPIDHKPKSGRMLARLRNLKRDDRVTLLVDHWDEDWTQLAWVMVRGRAVIDSEASVDEARALNARYPLYAPDERHDAFIRIRPTRLTWWTWS